MIAIKNVSPGVLLVADRRLRLEPGQVVEVEEFSPETERALALGLLVRLGQAKPATREDVPTKTDMAPAPEETPSREPAPAAPPPAIPPPADDLSKFPPNEALDRVAAESDVNRLRAWLVNERRRGIADAIKKRISEVGVAAR